jgi:hypothetical protein
LPHPRSAAAAASILERIEHIRARHRDRERAQAVLDAHRAVAQRGSVRS